MTLYYFHIRDGEQIIPDEDGLELDSDAEAIREGRAGAIDMLRDALGTGDSILHQVVEIFDEQGRLVGRVPLRSLIGGAPGSDL